MENTVLADSKKHDSSTFHRLDPSSKKSRIKRKFKTPGVIDLLVVVSGTTDPVNTDANKFAANWYYWEENLEFRKKLAIYKKSYLDLHIFGTFSWSGDNSVVVRKKAGEKLKNLIVKAYPKWKNREVALHFIGHSHGGNVINECTQFMAKDKNFPKKWSIKSILYLSTPFFSKYSGIDQTKFNKKCKVINAYNKYDLTQRVIADFSMLELTTLINEFTAEGNEFEEKLNVIFNDEATKFYKDAFVQMYLNKEEAIALWQHGLSDLNKFDEFLDLIDDKVYDLTQKLFIYTDKATDETTDRQLISTDVYNDINIVIERLKTHLKLSIRSLTASLTNVRSGSSYSRMTFINDLHLLPLINELITILDMKAGYRGVLLDLVDNLIVNQLDDFDNTMDSPKTLLKGYPFEHIEVSNKDPYNKTVESKNYDGFISGIETWEKKFETSKTQELRMEFLFRLLTLIDYSIIKSISNGISSAATVIWGYRKYKSIFLSNKSPLVVSMENIVKLLNKYTALLDSFNKKVYHKKKNDDNDVTADLMYFMKVAHSISRQDIYKSVEPVFIKQFESGTNPGYKPTEEQYPLVIIDGITYFDKKGFQSQIADKGKIHR